MYVNSEQLPVLDGLSGDLGVFGSTAPVVGPISGVAQGAMIVVPLLADIAGVIVTARDVYHEKTKRGVALGATIGAAGWAIPATVSSLGPATGEAGMYRHLLWIFVPVAAVGVPLVGALIGFAARAIARRG